MEWITNAAETIELDDSDATQVHSCADPDDPRMCIELDGMVKLEITRTDIRSTAASLCAYSMSMEQQRLNMTLFSLERITRMTW